MADSSPIRAAASDPSRLVGQLFAGRFRIERVLGRGGMGTVYLAHHEVLGRSVALKILHQRMLSNDRVTAMFRREARAASRIDHPNVTYVIDYGYSEDNAPYMALEYVRGRPLSAELDRSGQGAPFEPARALRILLQLADALGAAHSQSVVHRDLKPENILLTEHRGNSDFVKVLDFGLSKIMDAKSTSESMSTSGNVFGTPAYMSPEQCECSRDIDARADIYSFGVIAYELTCGRLPFMADTMRLLWMHANEDPPPPVQVRGYDSPLDPVILRCLAKAREDRYDSAGALLAALRQIAGDAQAGALTRKRTTAGMLSATLFDPKGLAEVAADGPLVSCKTLPTVTDGKAPAGERAAQQSQALDDLVRALRERGIGDPSLADHLAQKLRAEDAVLRVEAQIDLLSTLAEHHEVRTRERETRLRLALSQLEHEAHESSKGGDDDDAETLVGEREPSPHIAALARQLVELDSELKRLLAALQRQIDDMRAELDAARDAADAGRDALRAALRPLRQSGRSDAELMTLFLLAGV